MNRWGGRPGIIVSNDMGNEFSRIVEVVYLTTREKKPLPTHVEINSSKYPSIAMCEQIHTVSKDRIGSYINSVSQNELKELDRAMLVSLGINSNLKGCKKLETWEKLIEEWDSTGEIKTTYEHVETEEKAEPKKDMEEILREDKETITPPEPVYVAIENDPKYIRVCAERDIYKELYMSLVHGDRKTA